MGTYVTFVVRLWWDPEADICRVSLTNPATSQETTVDLRTVAAFLRSAALEARHRQHSAEESRREG